jgi:peptidoglycan/LPS O-acetylase OafA/YrhL
MAARLVRIVPLYWLATAAKLLSAAAVPRMAPNTSLTAWNTVASFLFLPSFDGTGVVRPVLHVGWTLSYEMLFYVVFAAALFLARDPLIVVVPVLSALALASIVVHFQPDWPAIAAFASPFLLEFLVGTLIGRAFLTQRLQRISSAWALPAAAAGLAGLAVLPTDGAWERVTIWGSAASVTLAGAVVCEPWLGRRLPKLLIEIGEASYSIYLTHVFVLPVIGVAFAKLGITDLALAILLIASCLVMSTVTSLLIYKWVEAPMTNTLRRMVQERPLWRHKRSWLFRRL